MENPVEYLLNVVRARDPDQVEFIQAVTEVVQALEPVFQQRPETVGVMEALLEPERTIIFRVPWLDDQGNTHVNRGFRVEYNSAIGPYKGGLRFHPSVKLSIIKFLGYEQIFKNALTTLPMGGGKGGSDFDPKNKSNAEVMRFCQSFMTELSRHIGANTDVPAGDIGVGAREIGYMYGQYKRIRNEFTGVLTGKGATWGGSLIRPEATGFGVVYFVREMLKTKGQTMEGKKVAISGFGNVAWGAALKATEFGAKVVTISGPDGYVHCPSGIQGEMIDYLLVLRASCNDVVAPFAEKFPQATFHPREKAWMAPCDIALPCATQNEVNEDDAKELLKNGCQLVAEGSNMGCRPEAVEEFQKAGILFAPGKASNAGGVAVSGLEMTQNSLRLRWTREEVDQHLQRIMHDIHEQCANACTEYNRPNDYVFGANAAGFLKVATAMLQQGCV